MFLVPPLLQPLFHGASVDEVIEDLVWIAMRAEKEAGAGRS
jgi:hypothetical protein